MNEMIKMIYCMLCSDNYNFVTSDKKRELTKQYIKELIINKKSKQKYADLLERK